MSTEQTKDPYQISGEFRVIQDCIEIRLQTNNPTTQDRDGQLFIQRHMFPYGREPFNKCLAATLKNLAWSVENEWENLGPPTGQ